MSIDFTCAQCKTELEADEPDIGKTVRCPVCKNLMTIPVQSVPPVHAAPRSSDKKHKVVVHIPSAQTLSEMSAKGLRQTQSGTVPAPQQDSWQFQIVVGWICVIVGIVLEVLLPRALFAYLPFFVGSFAMGIVLLVNRRVLHALILLLCTSISPPLLMQQNVWKNVGGQAVQVSAPISKEKKLVFDARGRPAVVSSSAEPAVAISQPAAPRQTVALPSRRTEKKTKAVAIQPAAVEQALDVPPPSAEIPAVPSPTAQQSPKDPYQELIENTEEIPPLIPEEELANTQIGHDSNFVWQEKSIIDPLGPGEPAPVVDVPFVVYSDNGLKETYSATGRLGDKNSLQFDLGWDLAPHSGNTCIYVRFDDDDGWVTVAWQHPGHNWGDYPGGFDLAKASKLTFWAKGEDGREMVEFMVGMEQAQNAVSRDSLRVSTGAIRLQKEWKKHTISLKDLDRSRILTGFLFRIEGQGKPVVFCLDDIQFE